MSLDRIERSILINATPARVWGALSNAEECGAWFGIDLAGQAFTPGARGPLSHRGYEHIVFDALIERIEPQDALTFHRHPRAVDPAIDYSNEQLTAAPVTFTLTDAPGDAILQTAVESGFDKIPPQRRRQAFKMNVGG